jgi:hypothetical protein
MPGGPKIAVLASIARATWSKGRRVGARRAVRSGSAIQASFSSFPGLALNRRGRRELVVRLVRADSFAFGPTALHLCLLLQPHD